MPEKRIAIIDLGTNTFNLLIAEKRMGRFVTLRQERIAARMGVGGINNGFIKRPKKVPPRKASGAPRWERPEKVND